MTDDHRYTHTECRNQVNSKIACCLRIRLFCYLSGGRIRYGFEQQVRAILADSQLGGKPELQPDRLRSLRFQRDLPGRESH